MKSYFITGTDTGAGKTRIATALLQAFNQRGLTAMGMKPVATGCIRTRDGLRNPDAEMILSCCGKAVPYELVNPYAFEAPIAPLFAANAVQARIDTEIIRKAFSEISALADTVIVEGIGGWRIHLGEKLQMVDLVRELQLEVILVVGLRLGCINHAMLSIEGIYHDGIKLAGWVANQIDPAYDKIDQTVDLIAANCPAPLVGRVPFQAGLNSRETASSLFPEYFLH